MAFLMLFQALWLHKKTPGAVENISVCTIILEFAAEYVVAVICVVYFCFVGTQWHGEALQSKDE